MNEEYVYEWDDTIDNNPDEAVVIEEEEEEDGGVGGDANDGAATTITDQPQQVEVECKTSSNCESIVIWRPVIDAAAAAPAAPPLMTKGKILPPQTSTSIVQLEGTTNDHQQQQWTTVAVEYVDTTSISNTIEVVRGPSAAARSCEDPIICGGKFECGCGRKYNTEASYRYHLYECGREPSFKCPYCTYKGKRNTTLNKHIRAKHQA